MRFEVALPFRPPLDWQALLDFLALRGIVGVERVDSGRYERTVAIGGAAGRISVEKASGEDALRLDAELAGDFDSEQVVKRARRIFDLEADPPAIAAVLERDPRLAAVAREHPGLRVPGCWDGFELAVRAVLGQQVTVRGAATLAGRLVESHGERVGESVSERLFPTPAALCNAELEELGLPRRRAATIRLLAEEVASGRLSLEPGPDPAAIRSALTALPGIGAWTAHYVSMRALRDTDAFPAGDLVLRKALADDGGVPSADDLRRRAEAWRPWRAYAAIHLWKSVAPTS